MVVTTTPPALSTPSQAATSHGLFGRAQQHPVARDQAEVLGEHLGDLVGAAPQLAVGPGLAGRGPQRRAVGAERRDGVVDQLGGGVEPVGVLQFGQGELDRRPLVARAAGGRG